MTDARLPDRWLTDRRLQRLSDIHFRGYITSLMWAVSNRTDGVIEPEDLRLIPNFGDGTTAKALVDAGLWSPRSKGWFITEYPTTQTSRQELVAAENARFEQRAKEREKKARQRAAKREATTSTDADVPGDVPGGQPGGRPGGDTQDRTGQARTRQEEKGTAPELSLATTASKPVWNGNGPDPYDEYK